MFYNYLMKILNKFKKVNLFKAYNVLLIEIINDVKIRFRNVYIKTKY